LTLAGRRFLIIGAGRSGTAAAQALLRRDADVTVLETGAAPIALVTIKALGEQGADVLTDERHVVLDSFDVIVPSPGVPEHHPLLAAAEAGGIAVWSEPELAWRLADGRTTLVAVTGTNGKTTTTELLAACLNAPTAGNIGAPLTGLLSDSPPPLVVAELSSFQLRFAQTLRPHVAVLLNLAPDHLDWHGSMAAYRAAKSRLWAQQQPGDTAVVNLDDPGVRQAVHEHPPPAGVMGFTAATPQADQVGVADGVVVVRRGAQTTPVVAAADLLLTGPHNLANVCAAVAGAVAAGADPAGLGPALRGYHAGRHRLEPVATVAGVHYVDDSKATNPHAAAAALSSFPPGRVVWIAGGLGKGLEFSTLAPLVRRHVKAAVTIGTSGPQIAAVVRSAGIEVTEAGTLDAAVRIAARVAAPGDTVLLAPACASMDQFTDYAERGQAFRAAVESLPNGRPTQGVAGGR
jgi:UDP-N-acetylmuramoylalanine--D-glutamate ligase